jgi:spoIIIJ-associated protein
MDWIEVTARTVEDAKELALDRLGVVEDELEFEVLDEPRSGIFRRSDARIRARVKPLSREKPVDRRRRRKGERSGGTRSGGTRTRGGSADKRTDETSTATPSASRNGEGNGSGGEQRPKPRRRRGRGGRGGGGGGAATRTVSEVRTEQAEATVDVETMPVEEQAAHAAQFAVELVQAMGFAASVQTDIDDEGDDITVRLEGENLGVLVGPRGVTLHAIEEVVRAAVQRFAGGHSARVHVDVGGYRERRREALAEFARKVAAEVREQGSARSLEPMSAADRKVVHDAVTEIDGVSTSSEGEDPRRRVVITPE